MRIRKHFGQSAGSAIAAVGLSLLLSATPFVKAAAQYKEDQEKQLGKIGDESRSKYINLVLELATAGEKANEQYGVLAKDKQVTDAVAAAKAKLGPTPEFVGQFAQIKRLRAPIFAETIKVTFEGKVPLVDVTLNGST